MKLYTTIKKVLGSFILSDSFFYVKENVLFENNTSIMKVESDILQVTDTNEIIFVEIISKEDGFERTIVYNKNAKYLEQNEYLYNLLFRKQNGNNIEILEYDDKFSSYLGVYNLDKQQIIRLGVVSPSLFQVLGCNKIICYDNKILKCIDFSSGSGIHLWYYEKAQVNHIIGVYFDTLWVCVNNTILMGINIDTGILRHQIDLLKEFNFKGNAVDQFVCGDIHLDPCAGVLKSLSNRYYWELDLNTLKVLVKNDFGADQTISWRIKRSRFYEGDKNLYFIGAKNGEGVNRGVGIFDTEKCDVLWYDHPLEEKKFLFFTDAPQASQTQLGVIDSDNTLRIYNKI